MDVETCREMVQHPFCAPGSIDGLLGGFVSKLKGRLLSQEDSAVLEEVLRIVKETGEPVKVYDVSRVADSLRALRHGVRKTPIVIIDGKKYESLEEILRTVSNKR